jgi:hypothetical protein
MVMLGGGGGGGESKVAMRSERTMMSSTRKLDRDRAELSQMREVLAVKLEKKRQKKNQRYSSSLSKGERRSHSAMSGRTSAASEVSLCASTVIGVGDSISQFSQPPTTTATTVVMAQQQVAFEQPRSGSASSADTTFPTVSKEGQFLLLRVDIFFFAFLLLS